MARHYSMTFGKMPTRAQFKKAFKLEVGGGGTYSIDPGNARGVIQEYGGSYTEPELFALVKELAAEDDYEGRTLLARDILETLGIEWI